MSEGGAGPPPSPPDGLRRRVAERIRVLREAWIDADGSREEALARECATYPELITLRHIYYSLRYNRRPALGDGFLGVSLMIRAAWDMRRRRRVDHDDTERPPPT